MNLQLKKFKPETMADDKVCVFIGKRGTGKSTLVADILYHKKHLPVGIVLSGTEEGNHYYSKHVPDLFIYGDYDKEAIERAIERQRKLVSAGKDNCGCFLLLDDCMYDNKFLKDTIAVMDELPAILNTTNSPTNKLNIGKNAKFLENLLNL